ncbi:hypothetical protein F4780DRAFT_669708 [Xylariomycetidae sp. FL0641]|nr:hypothetical protein F4780DRAFT_669708 [Xylariomycetidae sp. FL0641]
MSISHSVARSSAQALSLRAALHRAPSLSAGPANHLPASTIAPRSLQSLPIVSPQEQTLTPIWFNSTAPRFDIPPREDHTFKPESERKVKLGKTLRILQERLPTILQTPLPQEILSPNISLHLFPSTHPYLPTVSGRVAYKAAIWTSPLVWNRVPIIGNVRLDILSERMVSQPVHFSPRRTGAYGEQLVVKWRTASSDKDKFQQSSSSCDTRLSLTEQGQQSFDASLRGTPRPTDSKKTFTGLFVFEFDKEGRIISHTIEHVDEHGEWERGVGGRIVSLTDWLLRGIKGRSEPQGALPAFAAIEKRGSKALR